jgi:hypothetical protein
MVMKIRFLRRCDVVQIGVHGPSHFFVAIALLNRRDGHAAHGNDGDDHPQSAWVAHHTSHVQVTLTKTARPTTVSQY